MKTIGFPISQKENENRRALIPSDIQFVTNKFSIFIESGYGKVLGFNDKDYLKEGVAVVSREEVLQKDIICDPKVGDAEYLLELKHGQIIFGWIHAVQNREVTDILINNKLTAIAWEDMFEKGRHIFYRNNEIAGEAAIMHAYLRHGLLPYDTKVAILGKGNIARGAIKILTNLGASIKVYDRQMEDLFREELPEFDVVVNAVLWDTSRKDHIINRNDLKRMKRGAMIIDISCDRAGGVETSRPTTIKKPVYYEEGIMHYAVDHTPSLFYKTISKVISRIVAKIIDQLITGNYNDVLTNAIIVKKGVIIRSAINEFQNRAT